MDKQGVIRKFFQSLNPISYDKLATDRMLDAALYVPKILLLAFIILLVLSLPIFYSLPSYVDGILSKTNEVSIKVDIENEEPINIPQQFSIITIDKKADATANFNSRVLITNDSVALKPVLCQAIPITCPLYDFGNVKVEKDLGGYSDVLSHKEFYTYLLAGIFFMMLPAILLISYVMFLLKYFAIIIIFSVLALAISRIARFEISFSEILKISFYASSLMILIEIITIPFPIRLYYIHILAFVVYAILGMLRTGYKDRTPKRKIRRQKGQYVELHQGHAGHGNQDEY